VVALGLGGAAWVFLARPDPSVPPASPLEQAKTTPEPELTPLPLPSDPGKKPSAPPQETRNIVVCAAGQGHYRTITEALRHAQPGAVIRVRPGLYREGLVTPTPGWSCAAAPARC
jgi:hypothetical protein